MLRDESDYKTLINRKNLLKFIFDMRYFIFLSNLPDDEHMRTKSATRVLEECMDFPERTFRIIDDLRSRKINLDIIKDTSCRLYNRIGRLYGTYKDSAEHLRHLENTILSLELACPNLQSLPIELMEFAKRLKDDSPIKQPMYHYIDELLAILPYSTSFEEREYLSTKCGNYGWYRAFYFQNPSVDKHDVRIDFDALIISLLDDSNPKRHRLVDRAVTNYLKTFKNWHIDYHILKMILVLDEQKFKNVPPELLKNIRSYGATTKQDRIYILKDIVEEHRQKNGELSLPFITAMFKRFIKLMPHKECMEEFVNILLCEPNGKELLSSLEDFIAYTYDNDLQQEFLEAYRNAQKNISKKSPIDFLLKPKKVLPTE